MILRAYNVTVQCENLTILAWVSNYEVYIVLKLFNVIKNDIFLKSNAYQLSNQLKV